MHKSNDVYRKVVAKLSNPDKWSPTITADFLVLDLETSGFPAAGGKTVLLGLLPVFEGVPRMEAAVDLFIRTPYDPVVWGAVYRRDSFRETMIGAGGDPNSQSFRDAVDANNGSIYGLPEGMVPQVVLDMTDRHGAPLFRNAFDVTGIGVQRTLDEGVDRREALEEVKNVLDDARARNIPIVGHNSINFDIPAVFGELKEFLDVDYDWDENGVIDTGMIVKASQLDDPPRPEETLFRYFKRIGSRRSFVKWALDRYCVPTYGLAEKYDIDTSKQHQSASYDCLVTAHLLTELAIAA